MILRLVIGNREKLNVDEYDIFLRCLSVFHQFRQAKFAYDGSIFGSRQFLQLPQRPLKTAFAIKVVKIDLENNHLDTLNKMGETDCRNYLLLIVRINDLI